MNYIETRLKLNEFIATKIGSFNYKMLINENDRVIKQVATLISSFSKQGYNYYTTSDLAYILPHLQYGSVRKSLETMVELGILRVATHGKRGSQATIYELIPEADD